MDMLDQPKAYLSPAAANLILTLNTFLTGQRVHPNLTHGAIYTSVLETMAMRPSLNVTNLPGATAAEAAATSSPARGKEMRANLLQKLRPPPLVHMWSFWHDRADRKPSVPSSSSNGTTTNPASTSPPTDPTGATTSASEYEARLVHLADITDVRDFWSVFNNFDIKTLTLRDSIHLFHKGVKPVWEDPRNVKGGSWTFRVPKEKAEAFWKEVCLMGIGEQLQEAVESNRITFKDDICGLSLSTRFTSTLVQIWNRDAEHAEGVQRILDTVLKNLPPELQPKESSYYYKKHSEHAGFRVPEAGGAKKA